MGPQAMGPRLGRNEDEAVKAWGYYTLLLHGHLKVCTTWQDGEGDLATYRHTGKLAEPEENTAAVGPVDRGAGERNTKKPRPTKSRKMQERERVVDLEARPSRSRSLEREDVVVILDEVEKEENETAEKEDGSEGRN